MKNIILLFLFSIASEWAMAQSIALAPTFSDTRIINTQSVETLKKRQLDVRIGHRFGDLFGDRGGWSTFYGIENAADILTGVDYGFSDRLMGGFYRTKGAGSLKQLLHLNGKYRLLHQGTNGMPVSVAISALGTMSSQQKVEGSSGINAFNKFAHRLAFQSQVLVARRYNDRFSMQGTLGFVHRNIVDVEDVNELYYAGVAGRLQVSKVYAIIVDYTMPINGYQSPFAADRPSGTRYEFSAPLGLALEMNTGGHVFQLNFTNSEGITETDFIPYTKSSWLKGQFRFGFTISRLFNL